MATYCCTDLHGRYDLYEKICENLKPEDTVIFLGDATDRGPESMKLAMAIYDNPQWIYLLGNHEQMLVDAAKEYWAYGSFAEYRRFGDTYKLLKFNGGAQTFQDWMTGSSPRLWIKRVEELPKEVTYHSPCGTTFILSHAGYTPSVGTNDYDIIWSRKHFHDKWADNPDNIVMVHGHTPNAHLAWELEAEWEEGTPLWYCDNHKLGLDNGAVYSHEAILFNLDDCSYQLIVAN